MKSLTIKIASVFLILQLCSSAFAADKLEGRSRVELKLGVSSITESSEELIVSVGADGVRTSYDNSGFLGSIGYSRWLQEDMAVLFEIGGLSIGSDVDIDYTGVSTSTVVVSWIKLGVRYYMSGKNPGSDLRPYLVSAVGPVIGHMTDTDVGTTVVTSSRTETAVGAHMGLGIDIISGHKIMLGASSGYNFTTDFSRSLGGRDNYSGLEFALSFSVLFGKGVE